MGICKLFGKSFGYRFAADWNASWWLVLATHFAAVEITGCLGI